MLGFLSWSEGLILRIPVPLGLGFEMGTGIDFVLCGLASIKVITTAASTMSTTGTTSSKLLDAPADCSGVVMGRCGSLECYVVIFHLVKCLEKMRGCLNRKANRVE